MIRTLAAAGCVCVLAACAHAAPVRAPLPAGSCRRGLHHWLDAAPPMSSELVFGVGAGASDDAALDVARADAAKALHVEIREELLDTQTLWVARSGGQSRDVSEDNLSRAVSSFVARRMNACSVEDQCRDPAGQKHVLVACARKSELERALLDAARRIGEVELPKAALLVVPGSDGDGYVTQLGEYAARVLRDGVASAYARRGTDAHIVATPPWQPSALHDAASRAQATHLLRVEYLALDDSRVRVSCYLQDVLSDHHVPRSDVAFEVELEPAQAALLALKGPLLPAQAGETASATHSGVAVPLRLSKTELTEGDPVDIDVTMPFDGYLYVYDVDEEGRAALLLPQPGVSNHFTSGAAIRIPDERWRALGKELIACPLHAQPLTREHVQVIVSAQPMERPGAHAHKGELAALRAEVARLEQSGVTLGSAEMPYLVRARPDRVPECKER